MTKTKRKNKKTLEPLEAIRRLIMLGLLKNGITSGEIAKALGAGSSTIRTLVSVRKNKKLGGK